MNCNIQKVQNAPSVAKQELNAAAATKSIQASHAQDAAAGRSSSAETYKPRSALFDVLR